MSTCESDCDGGYDEEDGGSSNEDAFLDELDAVCTQPCADDGEDDEQPSPPSSDAGVTLVPRFLLAELRGASGPPPPNNKTARVALQVLDVNVAAVREVGTVVDLIGRTAAGESIHVQVTGWDPYLYIPVPVACPARLTPSMVDTLRQDMRIHVERRMAQTSLQKRLDKLRLPDNLVPARSVSLHAGHSIMGYSAEAASTPRQFLRVAVTAPLLLSPLREIVHGYKLSADDDGGPRSFEGAHIGVHANGMPRMVAGRGVTFNSNIEPVLQFLSDQRASGCQWCSVPAASVLPPDRARGRACTDLEVAACDIGDLTWTPLAEDSAVGRLRTLSFDIEVAGEKGVFPDPGVAMWPVIQVALCFRVEGSQAAPPLPVLLSLGACDSIEDARVLCFDTEGHLLLAFSAIVSAFDPDFITGYNVCNFDFLYLVNRAKLLNVYESFAPCTRMKHGKLEVRECVMQSAQMGKQVKNKVAIAGRVVLDLVFYMRDNFRMDSYTLQAVCARFLKDENKEDVHFTEITPMWEAGPAQRKVLGKYCIKDAQLPLLLMQKLSILLNVVARARVTKLPCRLFLERGMLVRFSSLLLHEANDRSYVIPFVAQAPRDADPTKKANKYQGATVLDVIRGLSPFVAVLDFASLYPSIIQRYNLCYSTYVKPASEPRRGGGLPTVVDSDDGVTVNGHRFVSATVRKGVVPAMLDALLRERSRVKALLADEEDPLKRQEYDSTQLALKVMCNSVYGAMGCRFALLPLEIVAATVTALGRHNIECVKRLAEDKFTVANGYERDAVVVGGDTDSIFISLPVPAEVAVVDLDGIEKAMEYAEELQHAVNATMRKPMKIEVEKVYRWLLLMVKKRYAGLKYAYGEVHKGPVVDIKGVDCVRRDGCPLVRNTVREVLEKIVHTGDTNEAAGIVRAKVLEVMGGELPLDMFVFSKKLRKSAQDCIHPMTATELAMVRSKIARQGPPPAADAPLTYGEMDAAIRAGLIAKDGAVVGAGGDKVRVRWRQHLVSVQVAWKLRLADPGSAPVSGEPVLYVVTLNGGDKVGDKAEGVAVAKARGLLPDTKYYLTMFRKVMDNIFAPIMEGLDCARITAPEQLKSFSRAVVHPSSARQYQKRAAQDKDARVRAQLEALLWRDLLQDRVRPSKERRTAAIQQSPIAVLFARATAAQAARK